MNGDFFFEFPRMKVIPHSRFNIAVPQPLTLLRNTIKLFTYQFDHKNLHS